MNKVYYRFEFSLISAMSLGCGENHVTDNDIITNGSGMPYIPGSTMAGVFRGLLDSEKEQEKYFGKVVIEDNEKEKKAKSEPSRVITYDAELETARYRISSRDCVKLDEYKTAVSGSKFDFQILEPGVRFVTYLEQDLVEEFDKDIGMEISEKWNTVQLSFGAKTMRGLGETKLEKLYKAEFNFSKDVDIEKWLFFDIFDKPVYGNAWTEINLSELNAEKKDNEIRINLQLKQKGGISVRKYTTGINTGQNTQPDYEQLCYIKHFDNEKAGDKGVPCPVIPGTTWAGAFRSRMENLLQGCTGKYFGKAGNSKDKGLGNKSYIKFGESEICNGNFKTITRNAIDRFTNATIDGALYTEKTYYNGTTALNISIRKSEKNEDKDRFLDALAAAIIDLHEGFLAIGGLTSVGRGIFEITEMTVNGDKIDIPKNNAWEMYKNIRENLRKSLGGAQ